MNRLSVVAILCTLAIIAVLVWPRFFPRYVDIPGGALDRWTGQECSAALGLAARARGDKDRIPCIFPDAPMIWQEYGSTRWERF